MGESFVGGIRWQVSEDVTWAVSERSASGYRLEASHHGDNVPWWACVSGDDLDEDEVPGGDVPGGTLLDAMRAAAKSPEWKRVCAHSAPAPFVPPATLDPLWRITAGARVRNLRHARGMSGATLAAACRISRPSLSHIEGGHNTPSATSAVRLARALGVTVEQIWGDAP